MSGRCKTCKFWTPPEREWDYVAHPVDEDTFEPKVIGYEVRLCRHPELTFCETPLSADGFGVADGSTYLADLYTAEEFGCVRWEAA